jgi:circadian clock protein KaiB
MAVKNRANRKKIMNGGNGDHPPNAWGLRLYIAGKQPRSMAAFSNLHKICEENLSGRYNIEVIDVAENPQLAQKDRILAVPTLVRTTPGPEKKIIGGLSDAKRVMAGLDLL